MTEEVRTPYPTMKICPYHRKRCLLHDCVAYHEYHYTAKGGKTYDKDKNLVRTTPDANYVTGECLVMKIGTFRKTLWSMPLNEFQSSPTSTRKEDG